MQGGDAVGSKQLASLFVDFGVDYGIIRGWLGAHSEVVN